MHFALLVALDGAVTAHGDDMDLKDVLHEALEPRLAPFDERLEVPPFRDHSYEEDWERTYREALDFYTKYPHHRPEGRDLADRAAVLSDYLEAPVSWDTEVGSFYAVSTENPRGKWDYWGVGGRYSGMLLSSAPDDPRVLPGYEDDPRAVTGAPKHLLDFQTQRHETAERGARAWDRAREILDRHPGTRSLPRIREAIGRGNRKEALRLYREQPAVGELAKAGLGHYLYCRVDQFSPSREEYVAESRAQAVPGYAFLGIDGTWYDRDTLPGYAGPDLWRPRRRAYLHRANQALDALPEDTYLVTVDCHV